MADAPEMTCGDSFFGWSLNRKNPDGKKTRTRVSPKSRPILFKVQRSYWRKVARPIRKQQASRNRHLPGASRAKAS
jgi:hypothetical protein